ncbi:MAG: type I 3-dehydroquinate dehydratase [Clostridium luticellarii]|jgi:3-dehydroquinate dehydratase-1|uniref:type I 3-dehydroquinate dehydratase n=1 Tax=Clostridium luticellarii TaxID=1691940 RepID=UPI000D04285E|nr:type I 3-dehydroquinate dehydratase [Clostridium luticellarii]MCI1994970.1 type I 3-dehydroquinate dehydratase [Clostridium luticellarii]MCI2040183.1 type I 3-dehydroquinate dehydratase [Clostridium luticellarii]
MKNVVRVRNVKLGEGIPKVAVPFVGSEDEDIKKEISYLKTINFDLAEWRIDYYEYVENMEKVQKILVQIRNILGDIPLIFTFRTAKEGGKKEITTEYYEKLERTVAATGNIDIVDIELSTGNDEFIREMVDELHRYGVKVIISSHDFQKTPEKDELVSKMCKMQELGADLPKIAVMPSDAQDVLNLLTATEEMTYYHYKTPVITISMGALGIISRIAGETFGSAVTFGSARTASAPGQLKADELYKLLRFIR